MTPLQQQMRNDLQLRGLSERTQEMSVRAVYQLAAHDHKSPARITEEELRDSFLSIKSVKQYSRSASNSHFGLQRVRGCQWTPPRLR